MKNMESRHNDVTEDDSEVSRTQRGHVCLAVAHSRKGCGGGSHLGI